MVRGRKPKPAKLRILEGNRGHRAVPKGPAIDTALPDPPKWLSKEGRAEWARIVPDLEAVGIARVDRAALALYCQAWADYTEAIDQLAKHGKVVVDQRGNERRSPWIIIAREAKEAILKIAAEFGLTPVARTRLGAKDGGAEDGFDAFLKGRNVG